jgi:ATP-dependent RNA helicase RhlE
MTFNDLGLIDPILTALTAEGYTTPTPIQQQAIPHLLAGRDLLGVAQTGTGKTAAFAVPILQHLAESSEPHNPRSPRPIRVLILTPTRELAIQIDESFATYGKNLRVRHTVIFGGVGQTPQVNTLRAGVDVLVATPGRLLDLIGQGLVSLRSVTHFVLDEADRMLDMGFINDVKKIIARLPAQRQTLFFSATMPAEVSKLSETILTKPIRVEVTPVSSTAETVRQAVYFVEQENKKKLLVDILQDESITSALVFARTKHGSDKVVKDLLKADISAEAIHGNKSQNARQRALSNFKSGETRVLVATDIAARGIDIDSLAFVVNYELPNIPETYVHRIGRTGRAGKSGLAISFCDEDEKEFLRDIQKLIGRQLPIATDNPYPLIGGQPVETAKSTNRSGQTQRGGQGGGRSGGGRPGGGGGRPGDGRTGSGRPGGQSQSQSSRSGGSNSGRSGSSGEGRR